MHRLPIVSFRKRPLMRRFEFLVLAVKQTVGLPVVWAPIALMWCHCDDVKHSKITRQKNRLQPSIPHPTIQLFERAKMFSKNINWHYINHNSDVIMSAIVSQITGVSIVYSTVCGGADQRRHQSSASLAFVRRIVLNIMHVGGLATQGARASNMISI